MESSQGGFRFGMNQSLSKCTIEELLKAGVKEWVLCPSSRNAPLVQLLIQSAQTVHYWPEERSASFFALGRARRLKAPIAVVVTSGTAAGELLPAVMEAYYSSVPLVVVTADRPKRFRGKGAPQSAEQKELFGIYTPCRYDLDGNERCILADWNRRTPLHLNLCFEEPENELKTTIRMPEKLYSAMELPEASLDPLLSFLKRSRNPLIIVGGLERSEHSAVFRFLYEMRAPVYLEAPSGLREVPQLQPLRITYPELSNFDGVLRLGRVPTHRIWRDLESKANLIEMLSISAQPFPGLSWSQHIHTDLAVYLAKVEGPLRCYERPESFWERQKYYRSGLDALLLEEPHSEAALIHSLSHSLPSGSHVYLGNSLPVREWDLAAVNDPKGFEINCTRGLNGIDGQISCFLGLTDASKVNIALLGDLTALYDFAGCWGLKSMQGFPLTLCIVNNGGGKIFSGMYPEIEFQNLHNLSFKGMAEFWGLTYQRWESVPEQTVWQGQRLIELLPDPAASERFKMKLKSFTQEVLAR